MNTNIPNIPALQSAQRLHEQCEAAEPPQSDAALLRQYKSTGFLATLSAEDKEACLCEPQDFLDLWDDYANREMGWGKYRNQ